MFPVIIPGATVISSVFSNPRCALYVLRIVPERSLNGAASVGVMGAGSRAVPQASVSVSVPEEPEERLSPKAVYVRLKSFASLASSFVSRCLTSATELSEFGHQIIGPGYRSQ